MNNTDFHIFSPSISTFPLASTWALLLLSPYGLLWFPDEIDVCLLLKWGGGAVIWGIRKLKSLIIPRYIITVIILLFF